VTIYGLAEHVGLSRATVAGTWFKTAATGLFMPNSGSDAVTLAGGRQLLVYNFRDHPAPKETPVVKEGGIPGERGTRADYGVRWPLNVSVSPDGVNWSMVLTLEDEPAVP
jgi:hypothetical protein